MAFNTSIGEQFEVVQRWLVAGNSSGSTSLVSDPFIGVPENGERRWFRYVDGETVHRIALDGTDKPYEEPDLLTRLQWGAYLFAPSFRAIKKLAALARRSAATPPVAWSVARGAAAIERLRLVEQVDGPKAALNAWKAALEDPEAIDRFEAASIWAAIRAQHGGSLKTPYGMLVADRDTFDRVVGESGHERYSVRGYLPRMHESIGPIYLGLDDDGANGEYQTASRPINAAIMGITRQGAFEDAMRAADASLDRLVQMAQDELAFESGDSFDLHIDVREVIDQSLATLCEWWFSLAADANWERGGLRADWQPGEPLRYPGHFTAPSRYMFQPNPSDTVAEMAREYGVALRQRMLKDIAAIRARGHASVHPIGNTLITAIAGTSSAPVAASTASQNLVGVLMGFLPTTDGALRRLLTQWLADSTFWGLRSAMMGAGPMTLASLEALVGPKLRATLCLRPAPEMIWRTATCPHRVAGASSVERDDNVVLGIASATQQGLEFGAADDATLMPMFGGTRSAPGGAWPTHACPGFEAAMGALYGVAGALLSRNIELRAGPSPSSLTLTLRRERSEELPAMRTAALHAEAANLSFAHSVRATTTRNIVRPTSTRKTSNMAILNPPADPISKLHSGRLAIWGDSWVRGLAGVSADLSLALHRAGYALNAHIAHSAMTVAGMAKQTEPNHPNPFVDMLTTALKKNDTRPKAVVLSAGGNDCKGGALEALLRPNDGLTPKFFVNGEPDAFVRQLLEHYIKIIDHLLAIPGFEKTPIILHGYGYPVPDGRAFGTLTSAWLKKPIEKKKYQAMTEGVEIMVQLIDKLNTDVMKELETRYPDVVRAVNLRKILSNKITEDEYRKDWFNELHPTGAGYAKVAEAMAVVIDR